MWKNSTLEWNQSWQACSDLPLAIYRHCPISIYAHVLNISNEIKVDEIIDNDLNFAGDIAQITSTD